MVKVIAGFKNREDGLIYVIGDEYKGERVAELTEKGFLEAEDKKKQNKKAAK